MPGARLGHAKDLNFPENKNKQNIFLKKGKGEKHNICEAHAILLLEVQNTRSLREEKEENVNCFWSPGAEEKAAKQLLPPLLSSVTESCSELTLMGRQQLWVRAKKGPAAKFLTTPSQKFRPRIS